MFFIHFIIFLYLVHPIVLRAQHLILCLVKKFWQPLFAQNHKSQISRPLHPVQSFHGSVDVVLSLLQVPEHQVPTGGGPCSASSTSANLAS